MIGPSIVNSFALFLLLPVVGFIGIIVVWFLVRMIAEQNKLSDAEAQKQSLICSVVYIIASVIAFVWFVASGTLHSVANVMEERFHFGQKFVEWNMADEKNISK